jgi:hypothetical protein
MFGLLLAFSESAV